MADTEILDLARRLLRHADHGVLATLNRRDGAPVATLVAVASGLDGCLVMLLSYFAEHTKASPTSHARRC